jgi:hypothetical protein
MATYMPSLEAPTFHRPSRSSSMSPFPRESQHKLDFPVERCFFAGLGGTISTWDGRLANFVKLSISCPHVENCPHANVTALTDTKLHKICAEWWLSGHGGAIQAQKDRMAVDNYCTH